MTAIAGVLCQEGLVIGADSSATFGIGNFKTIVQPTEKIAIIKDTVIVACTGAIGLAQRFTHVVETAYSAKKFTGHYLDVGKNLCALAISDFTSTGAEKGKLGALVGFPLGNADVHLCEFGQADFQPEFKDKKIWFASIGGGLHITDPFLAFLRDVFWDQGPPTIQDGIFAVTWTIQHACDINAGGIKEPVRLAVVERNPEEKGKFRARLLTDTDLREHQDNIEEVKKRLRELKERHKPDNGETPDVPKALASVS